MACEIVYAVMMVVAVSLGLYMKHSGKLQRQSPTAPLSEGGWVALGEALGGLTWYPKRGDFGELRGRLQGLSVCIRPELHSVTHHRNSSDETRNYITAVLVSHPTPVTAMCITNRPRAEINTTTLRNLEAFSTGDQVFDACFKSFGADLNATSRILSQEVRAQLMAFQPHPMTLDTRGARFDLPTARPTTHETKETTERLLRFVLNVQRTWQAETLSHEGVHTTHDMYEVL